MAHLQVVTQAKQKAQAYYMHVIYCLVASTQKSGTIVMP
jgi:hypothetical protein